MSAQADWSRYLVQISHTLILQKLTRNFCDGSYTEIKRLKVPKKRIQRTVIIENKFPLHVMCIDLHINKSFSVKRGLYASAKKKKKKNRPRLACKLHAGLNLTETLC